MLDRDYAGCWNVITILLTRVVCRNTFFLNIRNSIENYFIFAWPMRTDVGTNRTKISLPNRIDKTKKSSDREIERADRRDETPSVGNGK